jgi:hypothetical protein
VDVAISGPLGQLAKELADFSEALWQAFQPRPTRRCASMRLAAIESNSVTLAPEGRARVAPAQVL